MNAKNDAQFLQRDFANLDLDPIKAKLTNSDHGEGWSHEKVETVAVQYRRFLTLIRENPNASVVPTEAIDEFWHHHILDTAKYASDCDDYFGRFVHHFPYLGLRGSDDVKRLAEAFEMTKHLYKARFGESLTAAGNLSSVENGAGCGTVVCSVGSCTDEEPSQYSERPRYEPRFAVA